MVKTVYLTVTLFVFCLYGNTQNNQEPETRFLRLLNQFQADSLETVITDDFIIERTFTNYKTDRSSFLHFYLPFNKEINGQFFVSNISKVPGGTEYLVSDHSYYLQYLGIDTPWWRLRIAVRNNRVCKLTIDSTSTTKKYMEMSSVKTAAFTDWLHDTYPVEEQGQLYKTEGLYLKRLKEFSAKK